MPGTIAHRSGVKKAQSRLDKLPHALSTPLVLAKWLGWTLVVIQFLISIINTHRYLKFSLPSSAYRGLSRMTVERVVSIWW